MLYGRFFLLSHPPTFLFTIFDLESYEKINTKRNIDHGVGHIVPFIRPQSRSSLATSLTKACLPECANR